MSDRPEILAGVPMKNPWLYRRAPIAVADPAVLIDLPGEGTRLIMRDIEIGRAREARVADHIHSPADFVSKERMSGDRETATAQSAAAFLRQKGVAEVWTDRSLPMLFAHMLEQAGVRVHCDPEMDVLERRAKSEQEVEHLRNAQRSTEQAVRMACEMIAEAEPAADGTLRRGGETLTCEQVRAEINIRLLKEGMDTSPSIVASGPAGADPHDRGSGPIRTEQPVIVDVFPMDPSSRYFGDCTRTVVHGEVPPEVANMHGAVVEAKHAAEEQARPGTTGQRMHEVVCESLRNKGYSIGLPSEVDPPSYTGIVHGTGHGVGLELHEPPLLDRGGPALVAGDCLTIEPGLYCRAIGGVRVEDMVIVRDGACENLNSIPEGLTWA